MLEPAVRPGPATRGGAQQGAVPFEAKSFDQLLSQASQSTGDQPAQGAQAAQAADPLQGLSGMDQVENAQLRRVLAQARTSGAGSGPTQ